MLQGVGSTTNASHVENIDPDPIDLEPEPKNTTLLHLLSIHLVLQHTAPHLPISARLNLAASNRAFRALIFQTPGVFRHLELSRVPAAQFDENNLHRAGESWRDIQGDDDTNGDEFYSLPLRGVISQLRRHDILSDIQTLVLDDLTVTSDFCHELILDPVFNNIRILSIRGVKGLNERKLCASLQYACRPSRPKDTPRLRALYVFGESGAGNASSSSSPGCGQVACSGRGQQEDWHHKKGKMIHCTFAEEWAATLTDCHGIIAFDALPCEGPRHLNSPVYGRVPASHLVTPMGHRDTQWAVATFALPPCSGCGLAPEGLLSHGSTPPSKMPLLSPPPLLSASLKAATVPAVGALGGPSSSFAARCGDCIRDRYCNGCHRWWCEDCYVPPTAPAYATATSLSPSDVVIVSPEGDAWVQQHEGEETRIAAVKPKGRILKSCWECGSNCQDCVERTQRICRGCCGGYCIIHNEGSTSHLCDWCSCRGRFLRHL